MLTRVSQMLQSTKTQSRVSFGLFEADLKSGELWKAGYRVKLQGLPFKVLTVLLENAGEVVTREELQVAIWGPNVIVDFEHSLSNAIKKIREALGDSADNPRFIETLSRRGFRFIAPVGFASPASVPAEPLTDIPNAVLRLESDDQPPESQAEADSTFARMRRTWRNAKLWRVGITVVACIVVLIYLVNLYVQKSPERTLKAFWLPASVSSKPVLLCLPKPMVYRPSDKLFERYGRSHPNDALVTREARRDQILPLEPTETIQWGDMMPVRSSGPGIGAVIAGIDVSRLLTEQGIRFELRFGDEASYAEMRDSPVVIVGAINTNWVTQLTSELNFVFDETPAAPNIHETGGAKRIWKMETNDEHITRDYGLITRQLSGKAGQFLVQVAGISHFGTEAAGEFLTNKKEFAKALRSESINLQNKNFQIIVSTDVTSRRAGPPHVVAVSSW